MTPKDNRIAELESQVKKIYEKLGMSEETEIEKSKWVVANDGLPYMHIKGTTKGFDWCGCWNESLVTSRKNHGRKATPAEIETALRKEWGRRTKEKGWENPDEAEIEGHASGDNQSLNIGIYSALYDHDLDELWTKNGCVYHDGSWATPKNKSYKFFEWDVSVDHGYAIIGCESYTKGFLMRLKKALAHVSDKTVQEVLDEFKKLDL